MEHYVTCELIGRLGNNLFQISHAYALAKEKQLTFFLPNKHINSPYINNIWRNIPILDIKTDHFVRIGVPFGYHEIQIPTYSNVILSGFGQTEEYFKKYKTEIAKLFSPTEKIKDKYRYLENKNITAIHVRRGDYISYPGHHPVVSTEYLNHCMKNIVSDSYLIASDDLKWCSSNLVLDKPAQFLDVPDWETMWALSMCKNFILSNSTFSWWSAYLSNNDGTVYCPSSWFGPEYYYLDTNDLLPIQWTRIPTTVNNGYIYPV